MRLRLLLTINCKFAVDFFARGLHTRTAVARLPLRQLGFLVEILQTHQQIHVFDVWPATALTFSLSETHGSSLLN